MSSKASWDSPFNKGGGGETSAEFCFFIILQDAIEDLAEMKRIQDAIFNLSKSRQTAGSCS